MNGEQFDLMLATQRGLCAICQRPERRTIGTLIASLAVDHDHATGKVRGLLCSACNAALGLVGDSIPVLQSMIAYLERHTTAQPT